MSKKIKDGWDLQHLARPCWTCNGDGGMCKDCNGTGEFQEGLFYLQRYVLPDGTIERVPVAKEKVSGKPKNEIYGHALGEEARARLPEGKPFQLTDYQIDNAQRGLEILKKYGLVYFCCEVRTRKTGSVLECARLYGAKKVLFLTTKRAMGSIKGDYNNIAPGYEITVINDASAFVLNEAKPVGKNGKKILKDYVYPLKVDNDYDLLIYDESHRIGSFPRPSATATAIKQHFSHLPMILLSGTPSPENFSMLYHQFWISDRLPFPEQNFYDWARIYVDVRIEQLAKGPVNNYTRGIAEKILPVVEPLMVKFTQKEAGFVVDLREHFCLVEMPEIIGKIRDRLMAHSVVQGKTGLISADNAAALQMKVRQISSGSIILDAEEGEKIGRSITLSTAKADYIKERWPTEKMVIFYVFKQELQIIKDVLGDRVTTDLETFQNSNKSIALQIRSGREGLNLSAGEMIVFFSTEHSATSYFQGRDRLTTPTRLEADIYWLWGTFDGVVGIDKEIYDVVTKKKNYTAAHFIKNNKGKLNEKFLPKRKGKKC
jgi:hypothetical protein